MTKLNLAELLRDQIGSGTIEVNATVAIDSIFDAYEMTDSDMCLDKVLARCGAVALIWRIDDARTVRPDISDAQCWELLQQLVKDHNAGIDERDQILRSAADRLFGRANTPETGA